MSGEKAGHKATIGKQSTADKIARDLARLARLEQAVTRAEGDRKAQLVAEATAIVDGLGGPSVAKALIQAIEEETERTRPERERAAEEHELANLKARSAVLEAKLGAQ